MFIKIIIFINLSILNAAFEPKFISAKLASLSNSFSTTLIDTESIFYNPSALGYIENFHILTFYSGLYGMEELKHSLIGFTFPIKLGSLGVMFSYFGFEPYKEIEMILSHGVKLIEFFSLGYTFKIYSLEIKDAGKTSVIGLDTGLFYSLTENINLGLQITNLNSPTIGKIKQPISKYMRFGISFLIDKTISTGINIEKNLDSQKSPQLNIGLQLTPIKYLSIRSGITPAEVVRYSFGLGININLVSIDYAYSSHPYLQPSHMVSVNLVIPSKPSVKEEVYEKEY